MLVHENILIVEFLVIVPVVVLVLETVIPVVVLVHVVEAICPVIANQVFISSSSELIVGMSSPLTLVILMSFHESWSCN